METIVIFGGAGFVGKHLIRRLAKNGYEIIVPYQKSIQEAKIRLLGVTGQIIPFRYSSLNDKRLQSVLMNTDICINLKTTYDQKTGSFNDIIFKFNQKLLKILKSNKDLKQFIFFSGLGADIDKETLFDEDRITTSYVDQSNPKSILEMFNKFKIKEYDIIIDDGCHRFDETIIFFNNAINKLSNKGIYIIEDIVPSQRKKFLKFFKPLNFQVKLINFDRPKKNILSNCLITIRKNS